MLPDANIVLGGNGPGLTSGVALTFTLFPIGTQSGQANVTISVSDGAKPTSETFAVVVQAAGNPVFAASAPVTLNVNGTATPYPSTNTVSGLLGTVERVEVSMFDLTHPDPGALSFLLVGPAGQKVLLMNNAGGANGLTDATLVFADSAAGELPSSAQIISGTYQPSSYGSAPVFALPAPAGPYASALSAFNGSNPNGNWLLYAISGASPKGGLVAGGWQLNIITAPNVSAIADQTTPENTPVRVSVVAGDQQSDVNLTLSAVAANPAKIKSLVFSGSGASQSLTITPADYQTGSTMITVTATDGTDSSMVSFNFTITAVNLPPLVSAIANQTTPAATQLGPIDFTVWDPQASPITITASASDQNLVPTANIGVSLVGTSSGTNTYALTILPAGVLTGTNTITVTAMDGVGQKTSQMFTLVVTSTLAFANTQSIVIPQGEEFTGDFGVDSEANPYPSQIEIKGLAGSVASASVTLVGFSHGFPQDLDVLLVAPDGTHSVVLMTHAGGGTPANNLRLTFSDTALNQIPEGMPLSSGSYKPGDYESTNLPPPAPARPYGETLSSLAGANPNGTWSLYVLDETYPTGGAITGGWILSLQTGPGIAPIPAQTMLENTSLAVPLVLSDSSENVTNLIVTAVSANNEPVGLVANTTAALAVTNNATNMTLTITPTLNLPSSVQSTNGSNVITVTVSDGVNSANVSFPLTVQYVNQAPTVSTATNGVYANENGAPVAVNFTVGDVDSVMYLTNITASYGDPTVVPGTNVVVSGSSSIASGSMGTVTVTPNATGKHFRNQHSDLGCKRWEHLRNQYGDPEFGACSPAADNLGHRQSERAGGNPYHEHHLHRW